MTATPAPQSKLISWFWATRPFSLSASVAPVLVGTALAATVGALDWLLFALALTGSVAIQIGTNLTDEYSDHRKSGGEGKFLAPHKVIQRGLLSERAVALGMGAAFGYGVVAGLIIVAHVGWPILAVGVASVAAAYLYAGGPKPLGTLGLGEPVVFVFMGQVMVMASYYVQQEALTWASFYVSLPVAFIVTAILVVNNIRDVEEDREAGKRSLATAAGTRVAMWIYAALLAGAYLSIAGAALGGAVSLWALLGLAPLPWAVGAARALFAAEERPAMNRLLVRSGKLHGWTGLALAAGLFVSSL
ncbi:MAG: 1,4-dihydroxy-2-naphthoate octaprenyltransferase [Chloroflexi bacterium]|nr:1,4-dihydroxy-2-naphthoate octaprenyltransferase [Chloroflexota bacterium]